MKKIKNSIRNKELMALLFILLAFFLLRVALLLICTKLSESRENELIQLKMGALMDIVSEGNARRAAADASVSRNLAASVSMKTALLKEFVTEDGYTGPRVFSDGFVAELRGDRVILPREYRVFRNQITRELIDESLASGAMLTGLVSAGFDADLEQADMEDMQEAYLNMLSRSWLLSFGKIAENLVYVDLMQEIEYTSYLDRCSYNIYDALESADQAFDGITLLVSEQNGGMQLVRQYGADGGFANLTALGLTEEMIRSETPTLTIDGQDYLCAYASFDERPSEGAHLRIVQMLPHVSLKEQSVRRALLPDLVMVIIFVTITIYVTAVQHYRAEHELTDELSEHYQPRRMRRRMTNVGILCVLIVFACTILIESVGQLYMELRYGKDSLNIFSEQLEQATQDQRREIVKEEESWIVYYGEELSSLLSAYPELNTPEKLQKCCDILRLDYIMLFDAEGRQTLCSTDYSGFRLDDETDGELYDFRRLLYGVPSIVHEASVHALTGLERQMIGVKMSVPDRPGAHGALLMALMPDRTSGISDDLTEDLGLLSAAHGTICWAADADTGKILYSSNSELSGRTILECGLSENTLRDGYMDFTSVAGSDFLVITRRVGSFIYYYAVESGTMFVGGLKYGAFVALLFALVLSLLLVFLLGGYTDKAVEEWETLRARDFRRLKSAQGDSAETEGSLLHRLSVALHWAEKRPGEKMRLVLRVGLLVLIICTVNVLNSKNLPNERYHTMLGFLLHGDWMRGVNLFCLCSILLVISVAYPINLASSVLLNVSGDLVEGQGVTLCRLLYSCIKYITVIGVVYFSLEYLGFSTGTILASLGVVSLALSLGAQDLIADILAGLAIVFDDCFRVGDVVEINGTKGTVIEIGVRSTKLRAGGNNILIVNNHEITGILNMSKELTELTLEIRVPASQSLSGMEALLARELPAIGQKNPKIASGPYLLGLSEMGGSDPNTGTLLLSLTVGAMFNQKDGSAVRYFLNRELRLVFDREGIDLM